MAKEFVYIKTKEVGKLDGMSVEIGHYTVDGKQMPDKVYLVSHFTRKNGSKESKTTAICTVDQAKELGKILQSV